MGKNSPLLHMHASLGRKKFQKERRNMHERQMWLNRWETLWDLDRSGANIFFACIGLLNCFA